MKADVIEVEDRGEITAIMEPLQLGPGSPHQPALTELTLELAAKSAGFQRSMPDGVVTALANLVRAMNCCYSNLIEGHNTHPVDIERALRDDYSDDPGMRNLQLEGGAHGRDGLPIGEPPHPLHHRLVGDAEPYPTYS